MKRLILALCLLLPGAAWAQQCIPSGNTSSYTYFVAVDATDLVTRETGLSSFTVRRSRNGGASAAFTTPTVNETDSSNMPGVYELLLDEDMTIGSGNDVEHMTLHITHAGMAPVTKEICIARPKITTGETLTVSSGSGNAAVQSVASNAINAAAIADGAIDLAAFATDANPLFGITRRGTAQSATSTTLVLDSGASFADDVPIGSTLIACGSTQGYCQSRLVTDYTGSSDTATVSEWPVTPSGTITYYLIASAPGEGGGGGGLDAEGVRDAIGLASANLDTQLSTIDGNVDSILADTGTDGVVVASGSKTGYSIGSGGITSSSFANDAITAAATASDFGAEVRTGLATGTSLSTLQGDVTTLLGRLTTTRAGYLDKLNITGNVAAAGELETVDDIVDSLLVILEKLDTAMELDGEDYRFTANALEQAPAGEGGGTNITQIKGRDAETVIDERVTAQLAALNNVSTAEIRDMIIEDQGGGVSFGCAMAVVLAYAAGDLATIGNDSTYEDPSGTETRITGTAASAGNRTASVTCPSY